MKEFEKAMEGDSISLESMGDADFVLKTSYMSKNDLCFCGSGKKVTECCIPPEEFAELQKKERKKWLATLKLDNKTIAMRKLMGGRKKASR